MFRPSPRIPVRPNYFAGSSYPLTSTLPLHPSLKPTHPSTHPPQTAWRVQPRNYLLFACHLTNATAQSVQMGRFTNYWYFGGKERQLGLTPPEGASSKVEGLKVAAGDVKAEVRDVVKQAEDAIRK